jgi:hypothetical protein
MHNKSRRFVLKQNSNASVKKNHHKNLAVDCSAQSLKTTTIIQTGAFQIFNERKKKQPLISLFNHLIIFRALGLIFSI